MKKSILFLLLSSAMLYGLSQDVQASVNLNSVSKQKQPVSKSSVIDMNQIELADKYIFVVNNQFVFKSNLTHLNSKIKNQIQMQINEVNLKIKANGLMIDPSTKEIINPDSIYLTQFAAYNSNYTTGNFWWGTRYYFTSNSAVYKGANYFRGLGNSVSNTSNFLSVVGDVFAANPYVALGSNLASLGAWGISNQFYSMANNLIRYNNQHSRNQIYMDVNGALQYSFHILN